MTLTHLPHGDVACSSEGEAAGSRRSLTLTKVVRSNHARGTPVRREITAPHVYPHGESEVLPLPIPP